MSIDKNPFNFEEELVRKANEQYAQMLIRNFVSEFESLPVRAAKPLFPIAKKHTAQSVKCLACGSHSFIASSSGQICAYCRTPRTEESP